MAVDHGIKETPIRVLVSGGIGSGKSTVAALLGEKGAAVINSDLIGHQVLEPHGEAFAAVARRWPEVVVDGRIERSRLADIVFADPAALDELEHLTHPAITHRILRLVQALADVAVIVELPLAKNLFGDDWSRVVVDAAPETRSARAIAQGRAPEDVARRMAAQPTREDWRAIADYVVVNDGNLEDLRSQVDELWERLQGRS